MSVIITDLYNSEEQQNLQEPVKKYPLLASFLNLVVLGLGYFYARRIKKGIFFYLLGLSLYIFVITIISNVFILYSLLGVVTLAYFYSIIDVFLLIKKEKKYTRTRYDKWYFYILIVLVHFFLISPQLFPVAESYKKYYTFNIPTTAMSPTLVIGDKLVVEKGRNIKRNDIIVFMLDDQFMIKRCKGIPGDTLLIKDGYVIINNQNTDDDIELAFLHTITTKSPFQEEHLLDNENLELVQRNGNEYYAFITTSKLKKIKEISGVTDIKKGPYSKHGLFPYTDTSKWMIDNYGPIFIPKKGSTIQLIEENVKIYAAAIMNENEQIIHIGNSLYLGGEELTSYTFQQDHYFVMGDNRHNTQDSRYIGFIPEEDLFGKAKYIFWASSMNRIGKDL